jgi:hypothetical protein
MTIAYAGATIPFGMAKPVPDSIRPWQNQAGFLHDEIQIKGISQLHDEGTGGTASLGNFPLWMNKCTGQDWLSCPTKPEERMGTRIGEPISHVGSFSIPIDTGFIIGTELVRIVADGRYDFYETDEFVPDHGSRGYCFPCAFSWISGFI